MDIANVLGTVVMPDAGTLTLVTLHALEILSLPHFGSKAHVPLPEGVRVRHRLTASARVDGANGAIWFAGSDSSIFGWSVRDGFAILVHEDFPVPDFLHEEYTFRSYDGRAIPTHRWTPLDPKDLAIVYVFGGSRAPIQLDDSILLNLVSAGYEAICPVYRGQSG